MIFESFSRLEYVQNFDERKVKFAAFRLDNDV